MSCAGQMGLVEDLSQNFKVERWLRRALVSLQPPCVCARTYKCRYMHVCACTHTHTQKERDGGREGERERESVNRITDPMVWLAFCLLSWNKALTNSPPLFRQSKTHSCPECPRHLTLGPELPSLRLAGLSSPNTKQIWLLSAGTQGTDPHF